MDIVKASGEKERFDKEKFVESVQRSGAAPELAKKTYREIKKELRPGFGTGEILDKTFNYLKKESPTVAARYNLKRAIMELGPTGFPFEEFIAGILRADGYQTEVGRLVEGGCVTHEVDVIAQKGSEHFMVECKYHNNRGVKSDLKVSLYTYARFLDIQEKWRKQTGHENFFHQPWLVTNTRCTREAIRYANCRNMKVISWRYPDKGGLEYLIESRGLYPVTVLLSASRGAKQRLIQEKIIMAKDLLRYSAQELSRLAGVSLNHARRLKQEVNDLAG